MADYGKTTIGTVQGANIFASAYPTKQETEVTVATGQGQLKVGALLGEKTADNKLYLWDPDASDGTQHLKGVLGMDIDTTDGDVAAYIYVEGEFLLSQLTAADGVTIGAGTYNYGSITIKKENG